MRVPQPVLRTTLTILALSLLAGSAGATTLVRQGLERLAAENSLVLHGRVLGIHSYWNDSHTFIFTDVRVRPIATAKGFRRAPASDVTFTVMGGTVGDVTTLIVGGPELEPGSEYVLFLNDEGLAGGTRHLTVRDLSQGVFDLVGGPGGRRAVSQAIHHSLFPDASGSATPAGGEEGLELDAMLRQVRDLAGDR